MHVAPLGTVVVGEVLHSGSLYDLYKVQHAGEPYCLKTPASRSFPSGAPPADVHALGVMYYHLLTGQHPLFRSDEPVLPAWSGTYSEVGREQSERLGEYHARVETGFAPPSTVAGDITREEDALALALLNLEVGADEELRLLAGGAT